MKTSKLFIFLLSVIIITFSSCGDDDDNYIDISSSNDIVGSWEITKVTFDIEGKNKEVVNAFKQYMKEFGNDYKGTYTFNTDGTFESIEMALGETIEESGTYKVSNSTIYAKEDGTGMEIAYKAAILNGSLVLISDGTDLIEKELNKQGMSLSDLQITKIGARLTLSKKG